MGTTFLMLKTEPEKSLNRICIRPELLWVEQLKELDFAPSACENSKRQPLILKPQKLRTFLRSQLSKVPSSEIQRGFYRRLDSHSKSPYSSSVCLLQLAPYYWVKT